MIYVFNYFESKYKSIWIIRIISSLYYENLIAHTNYVREYNTYLWFLLLIIFGHRITFYFTLAYIGINIVKQYCYNLHRLYKTKCYTYNIVRDAYLEIWHSRCSYGLMSPTFPQEYGWYFFCSLKKSSIIFTSPQK